MQDGYKFNDDENRWKGQILFQAYTRFVNENGLFPEEFVKERNSLSKTNQAIYASLAVFFFYFNSSDFSLEIM